MERKEVIVAGKVFNLGLKRLDEAITEGWRSGQTIELPVGPRVFQAGVSRQERAFLLHWCGMTNLRRNLDALLCLQATMTTGEEPELLHLSSGAGLAFNCRGCRKTYPLALDCSDR